MFRRLVAVIAVAMAALFVMAGPATADYTPTTAGGTVSEGSPAAGSDVTFCGDGFLADSDVSIAIDGDVVSSVTADADGAFCTTVPAPDEAGTYVLGATGTGTDGAPRSVTSTIQVLSSGAAAGSGDLPRTGSNIGTQLWIAGGLLAFGAGLVALTLVRRRDDSGMLAA